MMPQESVIGYGVKPPAKIQRTNVVRINRELSAFEGVLVWYLD